MNCGTTGQATQTILVLPTLSLALQEVTQGKERLLIVT